MDDLGNGRVELQELRFTSEEVARLPVADTEPVSARSQEARLLRALARGEVHWLDSFTLFEEWRTDDQQVDYWSRFQKVASTARKVLRDKLKVTCLKIHPPPRAGGKDKPLTFKPPLVSNVSRAVGEMRECLSILREGDPREGWKRIAELASSPHAYLDPMLAAEALADFGMPPGHPREGVARLDELVGAIEIRHRELVEALAAVAKLILDPSSETHLEYGFAAPVLARWVAHAALAARALDVRDGSRFEPSEPEAAWVDDFAGRIRRCKDLLLDYRPDGRSDGASLRGEPGSTIGKLLEAGTEGAPAIRELQDWTRERLAELRACPLVQAARGRVVEDLVQRPERKLRWVEASEETIVEEAIEPALCTCIESEGPRLGARGLFGRFCRLLQGHVTMFWTRRGLRETLRPAEAGQPYEMLRAVNAVESVIAGLDANSRCRESVRRILSRLSGLPSQHACAPSDATQGRGRRPLIDIKGPVPDGVTGIRTEHGRLVAFAHGAEARTDGTGRDAELVGGLKAYLQAVIDLPNREAPTYLRGRQATKVYLWPRVLVREGVGKQHQRDGRQNGAKPRRSPQLSRLPPPGGNRALAFWEMMWRTLFRALIIGQPGAGKSALVRMTAQAAARRGLRELARNGSDVAVVDVPVCVRLSDVAQDGSIEAAAERSVRAQFEAVCPDRANTLPIRRVVRHIQDRLFSSQCWLFLDGLDEVTDRGRLEAALRPLGSAKCRVAVTSRPYEYESAILPFRVFDEYELLPLGSDERDQFIAEWFGGRFERWGHAFDLIERSPQLAELTCNPLFLTLTCATLESGRLALGETRRVDLYRLIVHDMLRSVWREEAKAQQSENPEEMYLLLQEVCWLLFSSDPSRRQFSYAALRAAVQSVREVLAIEETPEKVIQMLRGTGLIVPPALGQRMFVHQSFLGFLAAEHVSQQDDPVAYVERFLWQADKAGIVRWQPHAAEMICFLAGRLDDPTPLLELLCQQDLERRDEFRTMLLLAGRALSDAGEGRVCRALVQELTEKLLPCLPNEGAGLCWDDVRRALHYPSAVSALSLLAQCGETAEARTRAVVALGSTGNPLAAGPLVERLQNDQDVEVRQCAAQALGRIGNERAVRALIDSMQHEAEYAVRSSAVTTLGRIGGRQAEESLVAQFRTEPDYAVQQFILMSLGRLRSALAIDLLLEVLRRHDSEHLRWLASEALGKIGGDRVINALVEIIRTDRGRSARFYATRTLLHLGDGRAVGPLMERLAHDEDEHVSCTAAIVLGSIGSEHAVDALADRLLNDQRGEVSSHAARALGRIGGERAMTALVQAIRMMRSTGRSWLANYALDGLALIGTDRAASILVEFMQSDGEASIRQRAAAAAWRVPTESVVDALIATIRQDPDRWVRSRAAEALGRIGDERAVGALIDWMMEEPGVIVHGGALDALGRIGGERAVEALVECMVEAEEASVRQRAAAVLGRLGCERACDALWERFRADADPDVREAALSALSDARSELAVEALAERLRTEDNPEARRTTARALPTPKTDRSVEMLTELLRDEGDPEVAETLVRALCWSRDERAASVLVEHGKVCRDGYLRKLIRDTLMEISAETGLWIAPLEAGCRGT